eukprot:scaffold654286_cov62-Prasinocladus_malaysianus.AAC.1
MNCRANVSVCYSLCSVYSSTLFLSYEPNLQGAFAADMHNAGGSAYVMQGRDAEVYMQPYVEDTGANEALVASIDQSRPIDCVRHALRLAMASMLDVVQTLVHEERLDIYAQIYINVLDALRSDHVGALAIRYVSLTLQCDLKALVTKVDEAFRTWRGETLVLFAGADRYIEQKSAFDFLETKRTNIKFASFEAKVGHMPQEDFPEVLAKKLSDFLMGVEAKVVSPGTRIPGTFTDSDSA